MDAIDAMDDMLDPMPGRNVEDIKMKDLPFGEIPFAAWSTSNTGMTLSSQSHHEETVKELHGFFESSSLL